MKRAIFVIFILGILVPRAFAEGEMIRLKGGAKGWLMLPPKAEDSGRTLRYPAIILIHEWWGLNDQIKGLAEEFAAKGYVVFAVDLYRGKATDEPMEAHELMRGLPDDRALQDLETSVAYLSHHPQVDAKKIGVIGWSMGGGFALKLALADEHIRAIALYYGKLVTDEKELSKLRAPLIGFFGVEDRGIPPADVNEFEFRLMQLGKRVSIHIYPHAGHAFANPDNKEGYRREAAEDAWRKTFEFFRVNLS